MPKNKVANLVADYLYLRNGEEICEAILEAIKKIREKGEDPQEATLKDLESAIKHILGVSGSYDELEQAWVAPDFGSPIQGILLWKEKNDGC